MSKNVLDQYSTSELEDMGQSFWPTGKSFGWEITNAIESRE